jgi:hypothetical protein
VLHDGNVAFMTVEVDTTDSGQANDTVTTDANGNFVYQPQNLAPGTYTFNFRAVEGAYPSGQIDGPWEPFTFTVVTPNPPVVDKLSLADVTGPGTSTTTDPTLTGHVTADGAPQQVEVDFNYSGDGTVDDSRMANSDGTFTFTPQNRPGGSQTIWVRAVNVDDNIVGAWTTINFTLLTTQPPTVNTLSLLNVTGAAGSNTTYDPTVTGTLAAALGMPASSVADVTVEFDTAGDGTPDGADKTAANDTANTDLTLATTLTDDEAAFEETLATAGVSYQIAIGQSRRPVIGAGHLHGHDMVFQLVLLASLLELQDGELHRHPLHLDLRGFDQHASVEIAEHPLESGLGAVDGDNAKMLRPDRQYPGLDDAVWFAQNDWTLFAGFARVAFCSHSNCLRSW